MPLNIQALNFAIVCDGYELETHDVKQEAPNSIRAFVASESGKQFYLTFGNNLHNIGLAVVLCIDGERIYRGFLRAGQRAQLLGIQKSATSILPFKFQELELVDPDLEYAPVVPEMGTIEVRAYRCQAVRIAEYQRNLNYGLHQGRISERSKKAGWHHVSTADEVPTNGPTFSVDLNVLDPPNAPVAFVRVFYRPRELLMAQGVIIGHGVGVGISRGPEVNDRIHRKRAREDGSSGPSKRHTGSTIKEEIPADAREQRIQALQAELSSLMAGQSGSSVRRELRSPSPIVVGRASGEVVDLSLED
jgi:hypothetical protein